MKGIAPRRADFHGSGAGSPLPERPLLTTPPRLQPADAARKQRQRLAAQPWLGLGGLLLTAVVFFALALGTGSTATALLILGPISTFAHEDQLPLSAPSSKDRRTMKQLVEDIFSQKESPTAQVPTHEIDELLLLSSWFRRFPKEMKRTKQVS